MVRGSADERPRLEAPPRLTRPWVALELGGPREAVAERLRGDPERHAYAGRT